MGSCQRNRVFHPLDLEIIDRVYEAAWAQLEGIRSAIERRLLSARMRYANSSWTTRRRAKLI